MRKAVIFILVIGTAWSARAAIKSASEMKIPITTKSEQAKQEFLLGQQLSDNLQATKSLEHFDKAIMLDPSFASAYLNRANNSLTTTLVNKTTKMRLANTKNPSTSPTVSLQHTTSSGMPIVRSKNIRRQRRFSGNTQSSYQTIQIHTTRMRSFS